VVSGELRVRRGKGRKPRQLTLPPSALPPIQDWIQVRGSESGPLLCPILKSGPLQREAGQLARLSPAAAWRICRERGLQARIPAIGPHDLRRTWIGDLLDLGVDLATVQKMAGHASASTTGRYDRRDQSVSAQQPPSYMCRTCGRPELEVRAATHGQRDMPKTVVTT
jgi:integrase